MKKFKFSLQVLLNIKEAKEKQQKTELAEAERLLRLARDELTALVEEFRAVRDGFNEKLQKGSDVNELTTFTAYFTYLRERIQLQQLKVRQAEAEKRKRQQALIITMTEVKALVKLKETQYENYLLELKVEQEKEIGDFVSFKVVTK